LFTLEWLTTQLRVLARTLVWKLLFTKEIIIYA